MAREATTVPFRARIAKSYSFSIFWARNPTRDHSLIATRQAKALGCLTAEPLDRFDWRRVQNLIASEVG